MPLRRAGFQLLSMHLQKFHLTRISSRKNSAVSSRGRFVLPSTVFIIPSLELDQVLLFFPKVVYYWRKWYARLATQSEVQQDLFKILHSHIIHFRHVINQLAFILCYYCQVLPLLPASTYAIFRPLHYSYSFSSPYRPRFQYQESPRLGSLESPTEKRRYLRHQIRRT
jgi:hypothetical protein